jgi:hypothetical protein
MKLVYLLILFHIFLLKYCNAIGSVTFTLYNSDGSSIEFKSSEINSENKFYTNEGIVIGTNVNSPQDGLSYLQKEGEYYIIPFDIIVGFNYQRFWTTDNFNYKLLHKNSLLEIILEPNYYTKFNYPYLKTEVEQLKSRLTDEIYKNKENMLKVQAKINANLDAVKALQNELVDFQSQDVYRYCGLLQMEKLEVEFRRSQEQIDEYEATRNSDIQIET